MGQFTFIFPSREMVIETFLRHISNHFIFIKYQRVFLKKITLILNPLIACEAFYDAKDILTTIALAWA